MMNVIFIRPAPREQTWRKGLTAMKSIGLPWPASPGPLAVICRDGTADANGVIAAKETVAPGLPPTTRIVIVVWIAVAWHGHASQQVGISRS
jgi:hypothetical protein